MRAKVSFLDVYIEVEKGRKWSSKIQNRDSGKVRK